MPATTTPQVVYVDTHWEDLVRVHARATINNETVWEDLRSFPVMEESMAKVQDLIGDGQARYSFGVELALSDFGNKASCHVNVTLTCDQSEEGVTAAGEEAKRIALKHVALGREAAEQMLLEAIERLEQGNSKPKKPQEVVDDTKPVVKKKGSPLPKPSSRTEIPKDKPAAAKRTQLPLPKARPRVGASKATAAATVASPGSSANAPKVTRIGGGSASKPKFSSR